MPTHDDAGGTLENAAPGCDFHGVQTFSVPAGGEMAFALVCDVPGECRCVNHSFGHGEKGSAGVLVVEPA